MKSQKPIAIAKPPIPISSHPITITDSSGRVLNAFVIAKLPEGLDGDAGAPVILDDVLGFADPTRLRRLGPVFAEAAKSAQVILLTASPERYESIGEATFIHF